MLQITIDFLVCNAQYTLSFIKYSSEWVELISITYNYSEQPLQEGFDAV